MITFTKTSIFKWPRLLLIALVILATFRPLFANSPIQATELSTLLGKKAYIFLSEELSESEFNYLELLALRVSIFDKLTLGGEFLAPWDTTYATQNNILNILRGLAPLASEAYDLEAIMKDSSSDRDLKNLAEDEMTLIKENIYSELQLLRQSLWDLVIPSVTGDIILEILPAADRPESTMAVGTLAQFYKNLATNNGWTYEVVSSKEDERYQGSLIEGGIRLGHTFIKINGPDVFRKLFLETGVHRFIFTDDQVIGSSVSNSQTHTNYAQVRVYPTPRPTAFVFKQDVIEFQFVRSSGAGGQHVNKTSSAVHAKHVPSGLRVFVQQERSQHENRRLAIEMLRSMLFAQHIERQQQDLLKVRNQSQVISTTSPYVRTYNLLRDPINTRAILNGQVNLSSFNSWEKVLEDKMDDFSKALTFEINDLYSRFPALRRSTNDTMMLMSQNHRATTLNMCSQYLDKK